MTAKKATSKNKKTTAKKNTTTTTTVAKKAEVVEDFKPKITDSNVPLRIYKQIWKRVNPEDSRFDELAATIYWSDLQKDIIVEGVHNSYAADINMLLNMNISLGKGIGVSVVHEPKQWVMSLAKANLGYGFFAVDFMDTVDKE